MEKTATVTRIKPFEHKPNDKDWVFGITFDNKDQGMYHSATEKQSYFVEGKPCPYLIEEKPKRAGGTYFLITVPGVASPEIKSDGGKYIPKSTHQLKQESRGYILAYAKDLAVGKVISVDEIKRYFEAMCNAYDEALDRLGESK
jgi:hypothetical protein